MSNDGYPVSIEEAALRVYGFQVGDLVHQGATTDVGRITEFFPRPDRPEHYGPRIAAWVLPVDPAPDGDTTWPASWTNCKDLIPAVLHQLASI